MSLLRTLLHLLHECLNGRMSLLIWDEQDRKDLRTLSSIDLMVWFVLTNFIINNFHLLIRTKKAGEIQTYPWFKSGFTFLLGRNLSTFFFCLQRNSQQVMSANAWMVHKLACAVEIQTKYCSAGHCTILPALICELPLHCWNSWSDFHSLTKNAEKQAIDENLVFEMLENNLKLIWDRCLLDGSSSWPCFVPLHFHLLKYCYCTIFVISQGELSRV